MVKYQVNVTFQEAFTKRLYKLYQIPEKKGLLYYYT